MFSFAAANMQVNTFNGHQKQAMRAYLEKDVFVYSLTGFEFPSIRWLSQQDCT